MRGGTKEAVQQRREEGGGRSKELAGREEHPRRKQEKGGGGNEGGSQAQGMRGVSQAPSMARDEQQCPSHLRWLRSGTSARHQKKAPKQG